MMYSKELTFYFEK